MGVASGPPVDVETGRGGPVEAGVPFGVVPSPSGTLVEFGVELAVVLEPCPSAGPPLGLPPLEEVGVEEEPGTAGVSDDPWLPELRV